MSRPQFSEAYGLWQWKQAIAWIGFNVVHPRLDFHISQKTLIKIYPDQNARRALAFAAIEELLSAIETSRVRPVRARPDDDAETFLLPRSLDRTMRIMKMNCEGTRRGFRNVLFERKKIIAHWPADNLFRSGKISSQTACAKWLRRLAASGELFRRIGCGKQPSKEFWFQRAKEKWPPPSLSERSFDKAWQEVANDYPAMSRSGRKRSSDRED